MAKSLHALDRHFDLPDINEVDASRPFLWLAKGWDDMRENLGASLSYGIFYAVLGYFILAFAADMPYLFTAALFGFFLVGPIAAAGLYEISRRHEQGQRVNFLQSLAGLRRHSNSLLYFGLGLAIMTIGWERLSAILFALLYLGDAPDPSRFLADVVLSGNYVPFLLAYLVVGGALAILVYVLSVVSVPMLMDRDVDVVTAAMTSTRAVAHNLAAMSLWAGLIVILVGIGFATFMIGMVVTLPLVGHASWHAYKDLVRR